MIKPLYKATLKSNYAIGLFVSLVIMMYLVIAISMFDPKSAEALEGLMKMLPDGLAKAFGFNKLGTELTGYLGHYLYGFIFIIFPMIYTIIVAYKIIAKHVDSGSMAYLLTTPHSRVKIATTQAIYLISSLAFIFIINVVVGIIISESIFPGLLNIGKFIALNWITYLVVVSMGGIGFFFSCFFKETKNTLSFSIAIPLLFLVFKMISGINDKLDWLKYLSLYSFVDIETILTSNLFIIVSTLILIVISTSLCIRCVCI